MDEVAIAGGFDMVPPVRATTMTMAAGLSRASSAPEGSIRTTRERGNRDAALPGSVQLLQNYRKVNGTLQVGGGLGPPDGMDLGEESQWLEGEMTRAIRSPPVT